MKKLYSKNFSTNELWEWMAVFCCIAMVAGMFFSRVVLSCAMLLLLLNALLPQNRYRSFQIWKKDLFSWFCLSFFGVYLFSGLWSENTFFWWAGVVNKLPFVILPFAFFSIPLYKIKYQKFIIAVTLLMQLGIITNSIGQLIVHHEYYLQGYHVSQPLATTKYGDHIRFSLSLVLSILMSFYLLFDLKKEKLSVAWRAFLYVCIFIFTVYIHILAAKTGLVCLYLMGIAYTAVRLYKYNKLTAILLTVVILALPLAAYYMLPTFRTKINYVFYEVAKSRKEKRFDYTLSDAGRMITYDIGVKSIAAFPLWGVGAGDIMDEMRKGYAKYYPEVTTDQQFGPINQFLYTALCVGIPLSLSLLAMTYGSFIRGGRLRLYLIITSLLMFFSIMVESMLELQFGVFTYLFFILFWKAANREEHIAKPVKSDS